MKFKAGYCLFAAVIFAAGCAEERIPPSDSGDAWEVTADDANAKDSKKDDASKPAEQIKAEPAPKKTASAPLPAGVEAVLTGGDFHVENQPPFEPESDGSVHVSHYFAAMAPVEFKTTVTLMETELEGQNKNGAVPVVGLRVTTTSGKYASFGADDRPIDGPQTLKDHYEIGPGKYEVMISYYKDTIGQQRPTLTIKKVTFRSK